MDHDEQPMAAASCPDDIGEAFRRALDEDRAIPVDLDAAPCDLANFIQVCGCGLELLHSGRCARCAARNGRLICGKVNNHRGPHQAIAVWTDLDARFSHARPRPPRRPR